MAAPCKRCLPQPPQIGVLVITRNSKKEIARRRAAILELLAQNGQMKLGELAQKLGVSSMTLRRDIFYMQGQQMVTFSSGGRVSLKEGTRLDLDIYIRQNQNSLQKEAIAALAAGLVEEGDVIGLDASTSSLALSRCLVQKKNLTVITNNLLIPPALCTSPGISMVSAGGTVRAKALSTVGELAVRAISEFNYKKVFLSANALDAEGGLSDTDMAEIETKKAFIKNAVQVVVLADSTKLGKNALQKCCDAADIHILITDSGAQAQQLQAFGARGVQVLVAKL